MIAATANEQEQLHALVRKMIATRRKTSFEEEILMQAALECANASVDLHKYAKPIESTIGECVKKFVNVDESIDEDKMFATMKQMVINHEITINQAHTEWASYFHESFLGRLQRECPDFVREWMESVWGGMVCSSAEE